MPGFKNQEAEAIIEKTEQQETGAYDRPKSQKGEDYVPERTGSNKPLFTDDSDRFKE